MFKMFWIAGALVTIGLLKQRLQCLKSLFPIHLIFGHSEKVVFIVGSIMAFLLWPLMLASFEPWD